VSRIYEIVIQKGAQPRDTAIRHKAAITSIAASVAQTICRRQRAVISVSGVSTFNLTIFDFLKVTSGGILA